MFPCLVKRREDCEPEVLSQWGTRGVRGKRRGIGNKRCNCFLCALLLAGGPPLRLRIKSALSEIPSSKILWIFPTFWLHCWLPAGVWAAGAVHSWGKFCPRVPTAGRGTADTQCGPAVAHWHSSAGLNGGTALLGPMLAQLC